MLKRIETLITTDKEKTEMKKTGIILAAISLLCLLTVGTALAGSKNHLRATMSFEQDVLVNDTELKKGTYDIKFDADAGEVTILKGNHVVVTAKATIEMRDKKAESDEAYTVTTDKGVVLTKLAFAGDTRNIVISEGGSGQ